MNQGHPRLGETAAAVLAELRSRSKDATKGFVVRATAIWPSGVWGSFAVEEYDDWHNQPPPVHAGRLADQDAYGIWRGPTHVQSFNPCAEHEERTFKSLLDADELEIAVWAVPAGPGAVTKDHVLHAPRGMYFHQGTP